MTSTNCSSETADQEMRERKRADSNSSSFSLYEYLTTAVRFLELTFVSLIIYVCLKNEIVLFTLHPSILSIAWLLLLTEGILLLSPHDVIWRKLNRDSKVKYHWIIQLVGAISTALGFAVIYINKNLKNKEHFHSWHGIFGLVCLISLTPTMLSGVITLYSFLLKKYVLPTKIKFFHRIFGILSLLIGYICIITSLYTKYLERNVNEHLLNILIVVTLIIIFGIIIRPSINVYKKRNVFLNGNT